MHLYIDTLETEFEKNANPKLAVEQKAYMRNQFEFYGIRSPHRKEIMKPFLLKEFLPAKNKTHDIIKTAWTKPQRDFLYFAQELSFKYVKQPEKHDIGLYEFMVVNKSWWDTIDYIAPKLMGAYFNAYPEQRAAYAEKWIASNNIWLQRSAILFQLKYKTNLDTDFLSYVIQSLLGSKEFFINKAIGWILREYGKTDPKWVRGFVNKTELSPLSKREAIRLINKLIII